MARRIFSVTKLAGVATATLVLLVCFGTLIAVIGRAEGFSALSRFDWLAVRFTVFQAALSAILSVGFAIPVARAIARRQFAGKSILVTLLGAPFILPVIVAILGLTAVFGRSGWVSNVLGLAGMEPISIYGLHGVLIAHVFFNLPLATRLLLQGWASIPSESFRLSAALNCSPKDVRQHIEWPMLRTVCPGILAVIFLICTTSFAVALTFGGGPSATTVELAIFEAFRYDFDLGRAALLAIIQFAIGGAAILLSFKFALPALGQDRSDAAVQRFDARGPWFIAQDAVWITLATLFLCLPLLALFLRGADTLFTLPASVWLAALRSVLTAICSAGLSVILALSLAIASVQFRPFESIGALSVAASPLVIGVGLYLIFFPLVNVNQIALPITGLVNAIMALPFCLRALAPAVHSAEADFGRLADSLALTGMSRIRIFLLPRLRAPIGFCAGLSAALSMGDLGVIALFAPPDGVTLPLQIYRLMGAYRMDDAAGASLLLLGLAFALFYGFDKWGKAHADA